MVHQLFKGMLFNFHIFVYFPIFFCYLFLVLFHCSWKKKKSCFDFKFLKFIELVLCPSMWFILDNVTCALRIMCILWFLDGVFCLHPLGPIIWKYCSNPLFSYWSSVLLINPLLKWWYWTVFFGLTVCCSLQFCQWLLHILRYSATGHNLFIIIICSGWTFYHYIISFLVSCNYY